jgi:hypothetical protein
MPEAVKEFVFRVNVKNKNKMLVIVRSDPSSDRRTEHPWKPICQICQVCFETEKVHAGEPKGHAPFRGTARTLLALHLRIDQAREPSWPRRPAANERFQLGFSPLRFSPWRAWGPGQCVPSPPGPLLSFPSLPLLSHPSRRLPRPSTTSTSPRNRRTSSDLNLPPNATPATRISVLALDAPRDRCFHLLQVQRAVPVLLYSRHRADSNPRSPAIDSGVPTIAHRHPRPPVPDALDFV